MRTGLTMLGVIIGVAAVISHDRDCAGRSPGDAGADPASRRECVDGTPGQARRGGAFLGFGSVQSLKISDGEAILKASGQYVARVSPEVWTTQRVKYLNRNMRTSISGVSPELEQICNLVVEDGRFFTEQEVKTAARRGNSGTRCGRSCFRAARAWAKPSVSAGKPTRLLGGSLTKATRASVA